MLESMFFCVNFVGHKLRWKLYKGTFSSQEISQTRRMKKNLLDFLFDGSFIRLLISSIAQLMEKFFLCYEFFLLSLCDRFRCPFKLSIYDWSSYLDLISFYDHSTRMKRWFKAIRERDFFFIDAFQFRNWRRMGMCACRCVNWPLLMNQFTLKAQRVGKSVISFQ